MKKQNEYIILYDFSELYTIGGQKGKIIKIQKGGCYNTTFDKYEPNRYILDTYKNLAIKEDSLRPDYDVESKKYNL